VQVDIITLGVCQEVSRTFNERHSSRPIIAKEYIKQSSPTNTANQVFVGNAIAKVGDEDGALVMDWDLLTIPALLYVFFIFPRKIVNEGFMLAITVVSMQRATLRQIKQLTACISVV
jgi:hypothetical protein